MKQLKLLKGIQVTNYAVGGVCQSQKKAVSHRKRIRKGRREYQNIYIRKEFGFLSQSPVKLKHCVAHVKTSSYKCANAQTKLSILIMQYIGMLISKKMQLAFFFFKHIELELITCVLQLEV